MKILILGAGLSGLSVAAALKCDYEIIEKKDVCGGLCRSNHVDGFTFDIGGHVLHFKDRDNLKVITGLLGSNIIRHARDSRVCVDKGSFIPYPFQHNFFKLPEKLANECRYGFSNACKNLKAESAAGRKDLKSWIFDTFGDGIARHFLVPYNEKFWLQPLDLLRAQWAKALVPVPKKTDLMTGRVSGNVGYNASFWYPGSGGIGVVVSALQKRVKGVRTRWQPESIDLDKKVCFFTNGKKLRFDKLVSTIPLPDFGNIARPLPCNVRRAFSGLRHISVLNINLGVSKKLDNSAHWIYFAQKEIAFYRMGIPSNISASLSPEGFSSLSFEISYTKDFPVNRKCAVNSVISGCRKAGFDIKRSDIAVVDMQDIEYGYCVYDKNRDSALKTIKSYLEKKDVYLVGRYGAWQHSSMEDCMVEAQKVAKRVFA